MDTNVYTGVKKEPKPVVVTAKEKKHLEPGINAALPKATHHVGKPVRTGSE